MVKNMCRERNPHIISKAVLGGKKRVSLIASMGRIMTAEWKYKKKPGLFILKNIQSHEQLQSWYAGCANSWRQPGGNTDAH